MTDENAVDHVITNLNLFSQENDAYSEPTREIQRLWADALCRVLIYDNIYLYRTFRFYLNFKFLLKLR